MRAALRIFGIVVLVFLVVLVIGAIYVYVQSNTIFNKTYDVDIIEFEVPETTDELLEEGRRIFVSRGCIDCHGEDAAGYIVAENPAFGLIAGPNLTGGGDSRDLSSEDIIRAVLHGVNPDGAAIQIMPSLDYTHWREDELAALLVYLTNLEPLESDIPESSYGPLYRALLVFNQIPLSAELIDHESAGLVEVEVAASLEYGEYLAMTTCIGCHLPGFGGGNSPGGLVAPNLTPHEDGLAGWTLEDFAAAIQTGTTPDGRQLDPSMPYRAFSAFTDTEVEAIYLFLQSLAPVAGN